MLKFNFVSYLIANRFHINTSNMTIVHTHTHTLSSRIVHITFALPNLTNYNEMCVDEWSIQMLHNSDKSIGSTWIESNLNQREYKWMNRFWYNLLYIDEHDTSIARRNWHVWMYPDIDCFKFPTLRSWVIVSIFINIVRVYLYPKSVIYVTINSSLLFTFRTLFRRHDRISIFCVQYMPPWDTKRTTRLI